MQNLTKNGIEHSDVKDVLIVIGGYFNDELNDMRKDLSSIKNSVDELGIGIGTKIDDVGTRIDRAGAKMFFDLLLGIVSCIFAGVILNIILKS